MKLATGSLLVSLAAVPAEARMTLQGSEGPLILHNAVTEVQQLVPTEDMGAFEKDSFAAFVIAAQETGFFGSLVIDGKDGDLAFYQIGLHDHASALSLATLLCVEQVDEPDRCVEAARAVPADSAGRATGGRTLSRGAVPLFLDLAGKASPEGVVAVALSGLGHIAVSGAAPDTDLAEQEALSNCARFVSEALQGFSQTARAAVARLELDRCRVVFIR